MCSGPFRKQRLVPSATYTVKGDTADIKEMGAVQKGPTNVTMAS